MSNNLTIKYRLFVDSESESYTNKKVVLEEQKRLLNSGKNAFVFEETYDNFGKLQSSQILK